MLSPGCCPQPCRAVWLQMPDHRLGRENAFGGRPYINNSLGLAAPIFAGSGQCNVSRIILCMSLWPKLQKVGRSDPVHILANKKGLIRYWETLSQAKTGTEHQLLTPNTSLLKLHFFPYLLYHLSWAFGATASAAVIKGSQPLLQSTRYQPE